MSSIAAEHEADSDIGKMMLQDLRNTMESSFTTPSEGGRLDPLKIVHDEL